MKAAVTSGNTEVVSATALNTSDGLDIDAAYAAHAGFLTRVLTNLLGDGPQVDDLLQETFVIAFRKRREFEGRSAVRTWLYGIATRLALRHRRDSKRYAAFQTRFAQEPDSEPGRPDRAAENEQMSRLASEVLTLLPFKQREVFVLFELEELEGSEIAQLLAIPEGTVWTRLHHGRNRFQKLMRKRLQAASRGKR